MNPSSLKEDEKILSLEGYGSKGALADTNLTLADMLMYAVQDEYLAHAEYLLIMDIFGTQKPYSNIAKSEETHLALLKRFILPMDLTSLKTLPLTMLWYQPVCWKRPKQVFRLKLIISQCMNFF